MECIEELVKKNAVIPKCKVDPAVALTNDFKAQIEGKVFYSY